MASSYSQYKIELQATGENSGTWGTITNANFGSATPGVYQGFEQAIGGRADITMSSTTVTLTLTDTNAAQDARALYLNLSGTPGGAADLVVPAIQKAYLVKNGTNAVVTIKVTGQTGVPVPVGKTVWVYNNGTDVVTAVDHIPSLTLGAALPVASGGSGATTLTGVLKGNGTSAFTAGTVDLASEVTGVLPAANGGTGVNNSTRTLTVSSNSGTLNFTAASKTLGISNSLTLAGTDATTMTFPSTSATIARTDAAQTFTGTQTFSSALVLPAGTVSAPSFAPTGDTNTGVFFPAADTIAFATNGVERAKVGNSETVFNDGGASVDFRVEGDTEPNLLFVDASADRVGIGTNAPASTLNIVSSNVPVVRLNNPTAGASDQLGAYQFGGGDDINVIQIAGFYDGSTTSGALTFSTEPTGGNLTERMRIDSSGNVGIGTSSPSQKLQVNGNIRLGSTSTTDENAEFQITSGGQVVIHANNAASQNNEFVGCTIQSGVSPNVSSVTVLGSASSSFNDIRFSTTNTERARITSGGYFKASDTGSYAGPTSAYHEFTNTANSAGLVVRNTNASLTANGCLFVEAERNTTNNTFYAISYYNTGATAYKFRVADSGNVTNTNNSYGSISDVKLKQDIVDAGSQWDDIKNLRVRKYRWKSDPDGFMQMGLVAQEAELVSPGLIEEHPDYENVTKTREVEKTREVTPAVLDEDGNEIEPAVTETYTEEEEYTEREPTGTVTKAVKYSILYMKAVKALQEAMERIEMLEAKVAALEQE
jgi:hypothetical protein